jgi:hypothetical protein
LSEARLSERDTKTESKAVDATVVDVTTDNAKQPTNTTPTKKPAAAQ